MARSPSSRPRLAPVDRGTLEERVYRQLREALMKGHFAPGDVVTLRSLADAFGTSPMPVRAALSRLVAEQAFVVRPNRSMIVPLLSAERLDEIRHIRVALEGMLTEQAGGRIAPAQVDKIERLHDDMCDRVAAGDVKRYLERNQEFHFSIYAAANMPAALQLVQNMWLQVGPMLNFLLTKEDTSLHSGPLSAFEPTDNHASAVEALRRRDGPAARRAIEADISGSADYLLSSDHFASGEASAKMSDA